MTEENKENKKVLFRVSFSHRGDMPGNKVAPQMVTEWNTKRVSIAGLALIVLIAVAIDIFWNRDESPVTSDNLQEKQITDAKIDVKLPPVNSSEPVTSTEKEQVAISVIAAKKQSSSKKTIEISGSLIRAQLAKGIWKNEPFGIITESVKVNDLKATGIFYFTELENMKGTSIFHIWRFKGDVIFKRNKDIQENSWKTYTSKLFTKNSVGAWTVETVDSNDNRLNIINFDVVYEKLIDGS